MQIYVDLDNTLCKTSGVDYAGATPIYDRIEKVNKLYENNTITIYTARGSIRSRRQEVELLTLSQLKEWGVKYHYLSVGEKPVYDFLIDDRNICLDDFDGGCLEHLYSRPKPSGSSPLSD